MSGEWSCNIGRFHQAVLLNKFKKNNLKWKLIGNQGLLSAFQRPLNLRGRVYQESSYLQVVKGTAAAMQIIFSNSISSWATLRYIWSPRTLNWDHIFRPKIRPNPSTCGKNFRGVFFKVFWRADQDSEKILPKYCLGAEISNWLTLSVHDCSFIGIHRHTSIIAAQLNPHPLTYLSSSFTSGLQMGLPLFPKYHRHNCKSIIMSLRWRRLVDPAPSGEVVT